MGLTSPTMLSSSSHGLDPSTHWWRPLVRSTLIYSALTALLNSHATTATSIGDRCDAGNECSPDDEGRILFCDFEIGPEPGGYCQECGERELDWCWSEEAALPDEAIDDCYYKCSYKACDDPCAEGEFCSHYNFPLGPCQTCETLILHPDECQPQEWHDDGKADCVANCPARTCSKQSDCISYISGWYYFCNFSTESDGESEPTGICEPCKGMTSLDECSGRSDTELGVQGCEKMCVDAVVPTCTTNKDCTRDRTFCNDETGVCEDCPNQAYDLEWHVDRCFEADVMGLSSGSSKNCAAACHTECWDIMDGFVSVEGELMVGAEVSKPMFGTPHASVTGPLVDCKYGAPGDCGEDTPPEGFVCLISRGMYYFAEKLVNCQDSGGVAAIVYDTSEDGSIVQGNVFGIPADIPITAVDLSSGEKLLENLGKETTLKIDKTGDECDTGCSERVACHPSRGNSYCDFSSGTQGLCQACAEDEDEKRVECFLSGLSLDGAQTCANQCETTFTSPSCKICGKGVSVDNLQSVAEGEESCNFCPNGLQPEYRDREIPFIGKDATCFKLLQFFENYQLAPSDPTCQVALNFNYICGCEGVGYAGADTVPKQNALVWVPRVTAIMSIFGSLGIMVDVAIDKKKREKLFSQLMFLMSVFDFMGSIAYALTSLPIPEEYHVQGAKGNEATCTAQGFFIQIGTISGFVNVSLAIFYYLTIKCGWSETKTKKVRIWLFTCPVVVGLAFAFAGIPFYDMLFLWCNNSAPWWPDIPIIIAILACTGIMGSLCWFVYKTEQATKKYAGGGRRAGNSMANMVFWRSVWYLGAFYMTWPPYLALQYLWAAGTSYSAYGFILFASILVPLQGFWNGVVYFRVRAQRAIKAKASMITRTVTTRFGFSSTSTRNSTRTSRFSKKEGRVPTQETMNETVIKSRASTNIASSTMKSSAVPDQSHAEGLDVAATDKDKSAAV